MKKRIARIATIAVLTLLTISCGSDSNSPAGPVDDPGPSDPIPNPEGVLLEGNGADPARGALAVLPPSPAGEADIIDGLLATRLIALVAPGATVAQVNAALESQGARLVAMHSNTPFVTIKVPRVADEDAARTLAAALAASGAFAYASPSHAVQVEVSAQAQPELSDAGGALGAASGWPAASAAIEPPPHLRRSRMLPAWNVSELALGSNNEITVLIPDEYASSTPHAEIDAQSMTGFGAPLSLPGPTIYPGNNGFVVSGVVGANVDETLPTGTSPYPDALLDIQSMPLGGLTWNDVFWNLAWDVSSSGNRFVLNTGIGYNDPAYDTHSQLDRAMHVIAWRVAAALHYDKFLHVTSAGSGVGDPDYNSPFVAAARFGDVRDMVDLDALSPQDSLSLETAWSDLNSAFPAAAVAAPNVLVVGSSNSQGDVSLFSAPGDVQALGEQIVGPCVSQDPGYTPGNLCDGDVGIYSGTGVAAAQVSGLAAYMMNLGDASPTRVRQLILDSYASSSTGVVDAFDAVLALDLPGEQLVREALLDVAGFQSAAGDGKFDQYDLEALAGLASASNAPSLVPTDVYPSSYRRDFNGDFHVGGTETSRFDLNNDGAYTVVTQTIESSPIPFDENAVTDFHIVCYYAYSDVYSGDLTQRAQYVVPGHSAMFIQLSGVPDRVAAGETADITVTVGFNVEGGGVTPAEGVAISLELDGADAPTGGGVTDVAGIFQTTITFGEDDNVMVVGVWAESENDEVYVEKSAMRHNEVEIVERTVYADTGVFASYQPAGGGSSNRFIDQYVFMDLTHYDAVDSTLTRAGSASAVGMNVSGSATVELTTNVDLGSGTDFYGMSLSSESNASITLASPNFTVQNYQTQAETSVDVRVEFIVWGEAAPYNMHGNTSSSEYDVQLSGPDGKLFECDSSDAPCSTISAGGELAPGSYTLSAFHFNGGYIRWYEGCSGCTTSGTHGSSGSLNLNFEVNHNG